MITTPLKVMFLGNSAKATGAPIALLRLCEYLTEQQEVQPRFIFREGGELLDDFEALGKVSILNAGLERAARRRIHTRVRRAAFEMAWSQTMAWLRHVVRKSQAQVVYANTTEHGHLLEGLSRLGLPMVTHVHELGRSVARNVSAAELESIKRLTSRFVAVSEPVANLIRAWGVAPDRVQVLSGIVPIRPPVDSATRLRIRSEVFGAAEGEPVVVACGVPSWTKGSDLFVQVARELRTGGNGFKHLTPRLIWIGADPTVADAKLMVEDVERAGLGDRVKVLGPRVEVSELLGSANLFLSTSREDANPLALLEAAALQVPVVCFAGAGGAETVAASGGGIAVPYLDTSAVVAALRQLLADEQARDAAGRAARQFVEDHCSAEYVGSRTADLLEKLVRPRRLVAEDDV